MPSPASLREMAVVSGVTRHQARAAVEDRLINPDSLTWADALVLRVSVPVRSMMLAGEVEPRNVPRALSTRAREAIRVARDATRAGEIGRDAVLLVGRDSAEVYASLSEARQQGGSSIYTDGVQLALPIGQWWSELRWRVPHDDH